MCGIAGIVTFTPESTRENAIRSMTNRIAHRGPDAEGIYVSDPISLGHRRLSIIDLSEQANQPMWDYSGRYVMVFNGEIYNYQEIRSAMPAYPFKTQSDSEVVIAAYDTWGVKVLEKINGMFAFAIWDAKEQVLFMARDRVGKKPFYYHHSAIHFVFASEVRSILASGLIVGQLEEKQLTEYFLYQAPMLDHTLVKGIQRLPAGHYAILSNGKLNVQSYWSYTHLRPSVDDYTTAKRKVSELLLDAVRLRMVSDVPVGAFLSGGIDSSLVVACMAELSTSPVTTFTISFDEKEYDESGYAQQIASLYKTDHHRILIRPEEFLYSIDDILSSMDMPSGDGPNTYLVARHTRKENIKVALSGLGGDELFAGYHKFIIYHRLMKYNWLRKGSPLVVRQMLSSALARQGGNAGLAKLIYLFGLEHWDISTLYPVLRQAYSMKEAERLLAHPDKKDYVAEHLSHVQDSISWMGHFSKCTIGELETYTRDVLLRDTDQMSMAHALEVRVPFFDYRFIEYVLTLPDEIKYPHTPKQLLVDAMAPRLPKSISQRPKMGFTFPMDRWLKNELAAMTQQKIDYLADRKEFNGSEVRKKWDDFRKGDQQVLWTRIWKLVVLSDWLQRNHL
jgi:asparagine synthase (glutamine-hydrolysing)